MRAFSLRRIVHTFNQNENCPATAEAIKPLQGSSLFELVFLQSD
jgi:hypothetical protein